MTAKEPREVVHAYVYKNRPLNQCVSHPYCGSEHHTQGHYGCPWDCYPSNGIGTGDGGVRLFKEDRALHARIAELSALLLLRKDGRPEWQARMEDAEKRVDALSSHMLGMAEHAASLEDDNGKQARDLMRFRTDVQQLTCRAEAAERKLATKIAKYRPVWTKASRAGDASKETGP